MPMPPTIKRWWAAALAMGMDVSGDGIPQGAAMALIHIPLLAALGIAAGHVLGRLSVPAPLLLGGLLVASQGSVVAPFIYTLF